MMCAWNCLSCLKLFTWRAKFKMANGGDMKLKIQISHLVWWASCILSINTSLVVNIFLGFVLI